MATLKDFEDALRQQGMTTALAILDGLREREPGDAPGRTPLAGSPGTR